MREHTETQRMVTPLHVIVLTEQEMPGAWEIRCTACHTAEHEGLPCTAACHLVTWTPWGEAHAHEVGELHVFYMAHPQAPRIHQVTDVLGKRRSKYGRRAR